MIGFGMYSKKNAMKIMTCEDARLVRIDPSEEKFFDRVLSFESEDEEINLFIEAVKEVKEQKIRSFYKPIYDPSDEEDDKFSYMKGKRPIVGGHSFNWWMDKVSQMTPVEGGFRWHIADEYEYYAFLVYLANKLVESGKSIENVMQLIVKNSEGIGPKEYYMEDHVTLERIRNIPDTGFKGEVETCEFCDLLVTDKLLTSSNNDEAGDFWLKHNKCALADIVHQPYSNTSINFYETTAFLILK